MRMGVVILAAALALVGCGSRAGKRSAESTPDMHTAQNSLDYAGVYQGTTPAADCPGIEVTLTLHANGSYTERNNYLERPSEYTERGSYAVDGNLLTLSPLEGETKSFYQIEEGRVRRLDADQQPIEGALADYYVLQKTQ